MEPDICFWAFFTVDAFLCMHQLNILRSRMMNRSYDIQCPTKFKCTIYNMWSHIDVLLAQGGGDSRLHVLLSFSLHRGDACTWPLRFVHRKAFMFDTKVYREVLIVDTKVCMPCICHWLLPSQIYTWLGTFDCTERWWCMHMVTDFWLHREVMMHAHGHWLLTAQRGDDNACTWSLTFDCTERWW